MKPPHWENYLREFEAASKVNEWSSMEKAISLTLALRGDVTNILQTLSSEESEDYEQLVRQLEMRYGQTNLEHVYHSQLKNRYQKSNETLKEFQGDIARLVPLVYPATPERIMERLVVQAFLGGLQDSETRQALIFQAGKLVDLNFKLGILEINGEEVILHGRVGNRVCVVLAEDPVVPERCEVILDDCPDGHLTTEASLCC